MLGQRIKYTVQTKTHAKTDYAHQVFDRMLSVPRQLLEWPKTPGRVSLDVGDDGKIIWAKPETTVLDRKKKVSLHALKILQWVHSPGLKGLVGRATSRKKLRVTSAK